MDINAVALCDVADHSVECGAKPMAHFLFRLRDATDPFGIEMHIYPPRVTFKQQLLLSCLYETNSSPQMAGRFF